MRRLLIVRPLQYLHQALQHRLADVATAVVGAGLLVRRAARDDARRDLLAAMAAWFAARTARWTAEVSLHVHGGYGFVRQLTADGKTNHLESIWRDSKVGEIYEGANEVQLWSIARVALGRDITG